VQADHEQELLIRDIRDSGQRAQGSFETASEQWRVVRLFGALSLEQNDEWQLQRRYMQLEELRALSNNQPARLSAVVS